MPFIQDTFTDTNGTGLASHTSDSGHVYTPESGSADAAEILNNRLVSTSTSGSYYEADTSIPGSYVARFTLEHFTNPSQNRAGLVLLGTGWDDSLWAYWNGVDGEWQVTTWTTTLDSETDTLSAGTIECMVRVDYGSPARARLYVFEGGNWVLKCDSDIGVAGDIPDSPGIVGVFIQGVHGASVGTHIDSLSTTINGEGSPSLTGFTSSSVGEVAVEGSGSGTLIGLSATGEGSVSSSAISGSGSPSLPLLSSSGQVAALVKGIAAGTLFVLVSTGAGTIDVQGSGSPTLPGLSSVGVGTVVSGIEGSGSPSLIGLSASGQGAVSVVGTGTGVLPQLTSTGTSASPVEGSGSPTLPTLVGAGAGLAGDAVTTNEGYIAYLNAGVELRLDKIMSLGLVNLATFPYVYSPKRFYNIVGEADGSTIRAKVWHDGEAEPGWQISVVDGEYPSGAPGLVALAETVVDFDVFATGLGGDPYPTGRNPGTPVWLSPTVPFSVVNGELELVWLRPPMANGVIGGDVSYELQYRRNNGEAWTDLATVIEQESYLWDTSQLAQSNDYCVQVRCLVACEAGPWVELCSIAVVDEPSEDCPEDNPEEGQPVEVGDCLGGLPNNFDDCDGGIAVTYEACGGGADTTPQLPEPSCPPEEEA